VIRAAREDNWPLHLSAIRELIPWCFAYDKVNYGRYLPAYYASMTQMSEEEPDVHRTLMNGCFSVQQSNNNSFGRIPVNQTIEVTDNIDTQTSGGTTKFSLKQSAVKRYYLTTEHRSFFPRQLKNMVKS
jgi:hypothetical protein